jgi:glycosyltransferase involved in cell wall biosynthesis
MRSLKKKWLARITRDVDWMMTANSRGVAYWRYYGVPKERIVVCPYYADYPRIDAARKTERHAVLQRIGVAPDKKVLFSAARLVPAKGLDLFIPQVLGVLPRKEWTYVIAGVGPMESELKQLVAQAWAAGETDDPVRFIGFQQPANNLALMSHADALALPSRYEPHGIVVAEAMAAGTPVLASDVVGAAKDLVESDSNGLIFHVNSAASLQNSLEKLKDSAQMGTMRARARSAFEAWYRQTSPMLVVPRMVRMMLAAKKGKVEGRR